MARHRLHKMELPTDRWSARAVSPVDLSKGIDTSRHGEVILLHPGWGKSPERHAELLIKLANSGFLPIGVDTRYAYADRQQPRKRILSQPLQVGTTNPYFEAAGFSGNRWEYRRPTVLLEICRRLDIEAMSLIGHSDGGRVAALAATANPHQVRKLIVVNGAGTGDSSNGLRRLLKSNVERMKEFKASGVSGAETTVSALGSIAYATSHPRRTLAEKRVINSTDTWAILGDLSDVVDVTVFHAEDDELITFDDSKGRSAKSPSVEFVPTVGGHSNIYEPGVQELIVDTLSR